QKVEFENYRYRLWHLEMGEMDSAKRLEAEQKVLEEALELEETSLNAI
ncbi:3310_t:CDS:1, partial [Paraglomus occultum]